MNLTLTNAAELEAALKQAVHHFQRGDDDSAEAIYRSILQQVPNNVMANRNLGLLLQYHDRHEDALPFFIKALEAVPNNAGNWDSLVDGLIRCGYFQDALQHLNKAISAGLPGPMIESLKLKLALATDKDDDRPRPEHEKRIEQSLQQDPPQQAESLLRLVVQYYPDHKPGWLKLSDLLRQRGKYPPAIAIARKAWVRFPDDQTIGTRLAALLTESRQLQPAREQLHDLTERFPDDDELQLALAQTQVALGDLDAANDAFAEAVRLNPDNPVARIMPALTLPVIPRSVAHIEHWRQHCREQTDLLSRQFAERSDEAEPPLTEHQLLQLPNNFYLSYHDINNRELASHRAQLIGHLYPPLHFRAPALDDWQPPQPGERKIRLGLISSFFHTHTIGKLNLGFFQQLDNTRFDIVAIHLPDSSRPHSPQALASDPLRQAIEAHASEVITLDTQLQTQQQQLADAGLDVLFYTDIGMVPGSYYLAFSRLAPVQIVSWGHPDTTGLDTVDYFLSSSLLETDNAREHYQETLVTLDNLPCYYPFPTQMAQQAAVDRQTLGLPAEGRLYGCPQSLFKFHPDFDQALAAIIANDPQAWIILIEGSHPAWQAQLVQRWQDNHPELSARVRFLPRMPTEHFLSLIHHMDVLLDPVHFGSGNTLYEAMAMGTPIVTWPGRFMRGRIVAGAYQQMGLDDAPIADSQAAYPELAVALAGDKVRRDRLKADIAAKRDRLFDDQQTIRQMEDILVNAVNNAMRH